MKLETVKKRLKGYRSTEILNPNHSVVVFENGNILQSYDSIIAVKLDKKIYLGKDWDYSKTTGKFRNMHLGTTKKEVLEKLETGEYKLLN